MGTSKQSSRLIPSRLPQVILLLDKKLRIKSANDSFYKSFHVTQDEIAGKFLFEVNNGELDNRVLRKKLATVLKEKKDSIETEINIASPNLGNRILHLSMQSLKSSNRELMILLVLDDAALPKEAGQVRIKIQGEDDLKILEFIPQIIVTLTSNDKVAFFNKYFLDYSGLTLKEAIEGGWKKIIHPNDLEKVVEKGKISLATGENFYMEIRFWHHTQGTYCWHLARGIPIRDGESKLISWLGTAVDINEQKVKEEKKDEFISIASHEMRTPLTTAKAYLQILEEALLKENNEIKLYVTNAAKAIGKLEALVSELLDVSKIQNGKLTYNVTSFNFNEMIDDAITEVKYVYPNHEIIKTEMIVPEVKGDRQRLQQVVINLLTNAVKYSPNAEKILIDLAQDKNKITVSVTDFGIGILKANLERIFERYFQIESHKINFQGLGIGLFISQEIIARHDGNIWAESEPGKGSTFYFSIPFECNPNNSQ